MATNLKTKSYQYLHHDLRSKIVERRLLPGMALPSENTIAADYGVSRPTVRKALELLEQDNYIFRRAGIGSFVSDQTNAGGRKSRRQLTVGADMYVGDATFYTGMLLGGVKRGCENFGCRLTLVGKNDLLPGSADVDALVLSTAGADDYPHLAGMVAAGRPVALINRFPTQPELAYFSVDYVAEAEKAVEHLLLLGHRDIAVIGASFDNNVATAARTRGWEQAYMRRGLTPPQHLCFPYEDVHGGYEKMVAFFQHNRVSAVFVSLGYLISPTAQALSRLGLRVPADVSVMCFDDVEEMQELLGIPVSYVKMPLNIMGRQAVEHVVQRINAPGTPVARKIFDASLVINSGCRSFEADKFNNI